MRFFLDEEEKPKRKRLRRAAISESDGSESESDEPEDEANVITHLMYDGKREFEWKETYAIDNRLHPIEFNSLNKELINPPCSNVNERSRDS